MDTEYQILRRPAVIAARSVTYAVKQRVGLAAAHTVSFTMQREYKNLAPPPLPSSGPDFPKFRLALRLSQNRILNFLPPISLVSSAPAVISSFLASPASCASFCFPCFFCILCFFCVSHRFHFLLLFALSFFSAFLFVFLPPLLNLNRVVKLKCFFRIPTKLLRHSVCEQKKQPMKYFFIFCNAVAERVQTLMPGCFGDRLYTLSVPQV